MTSKTMIANLQDFFFFGIFLHFYIEVYLITKPKGEFQAKGLDREIAGSQWYISHLPFLAIY